MEKRKFLLGWLFTKFVILGAIGLILGFDYVLTQFWYKSSDFDISRIISEQKNLNETDDRGFTALMNACAEGNLDDVKMLCETGADINIKAANPVGNTALHIACINKKTDVIKFLLNHNANFFTYNTGDKGSVPFHFLVNFTDNNVFKELVQAFVDRGANINLPDKVRGMSLLFWAIDMDRTDFVSILTNNFGHLIDFGQTNKSGDTALTFAQKDNVIELYEIVDILQSVKPHTFRADVPIDKYDKNGFTQTMVAAIKGNDGYLKNVTSAGANLNLKDKTKQGNTALHWACLYDRTNSVDFLIQNDADVKKKNNYGQSPIHCVFGIRDRLKRKDVIESLISNGADINDRDNKDDTLLHRLVRFSEYQMVKQLVDNFKSSIDFSIKNKSKMSALDIAKKRGDTLLIKFLEPLFLTKK